MAYQISEQPVYVYDVEKKKNLVFDGVTKIQHAITLKMEDDPDNKKGNNYVNNAQNEPDEVAIDVVMSNVYATANDLSGSTGDRAKNAYTYLMELKKARRKVNVVTYYATYMNMLLKSVALVQDDTNQFGWYGTLTFREAVESKGSGGGASSTNNSSATSDGTQGGRTPSVWVSWVGANAI